MVVEFIGLHVADALVAGVENRHFISSFQLNYTLEYVSIFEHVDLGQVNVVYFCFHVDGVLIYLLKLEEVVDLLVTTLRK